MASLGSFRKLIDVLSGLGADVCLNEGNSDDEIQRIENKYGWRFPEELREAYRFADGEAGTAFGMLGVDCRFLPLHQMDTVTQTIRNMVAFIGDECEIDARGPMLPVAYNRAWIPVFGSPYSNYFVDLAPAPNGVSGQVILVSPEHSVGCVVAPSFDAFIADLTQRMVAGEFERTDDGLWLVALDEQLLFESE